MAHPELPTQVLTLPEFPLSAIPIVSAALAPWPFGGAPVAVDPVDKHLNLPQIRDYFLWLVSLCSHLDPPFSYT